MSPHQLGVPQFRERVYILGVHKRLGIDQINVFLPTPPSFFDIYKSIVEEHPKEKYNISEYEVKVLTCWDEFYQGIKETVLGFPVWVSEFGKTYDLSELPKWQSTFCEKNRKLYLNNKVFLDGWLTRWNGLKDFSPTHRKFEYQAGKDIKSIWEGFIQFRPSGIRVKRPTFFPALVAMVQIPIIGKYRRRLTPREAARLQSFPDDFEINENDHQAYKQFGNSVNVNCVKFLANQLFSLPKSSEENDFELTG